VSTVYLAVQESLEREVALKVMAPALAAEPNFTERFIREGRTIAQLAHPGIITIYDISVAEYQHYIAMEYLAGGSLKLRMLKPLPVANALAILRQVAAALGYAHQKGFVHRDVKPENIIFRDPNTAVLTDFGIAKSTGSETHLTSIGVIVGTPRYMSPEQADGRGTDPRSDIYALGVVLYEMLAGRPPYDAKESIALLYSHINDPIPELPDESSALQPLINDMMAKDPDERVPDCETLVELVRRAQRGQRVASRTPPPLTAPARTPVRRQGAWPIALWTGIALAVTFIVAAAIRTMMQEPEQDRQSTVAIKESTATLPPLPAPQRAAPATSATPKAGSTGTKSGANKVAPVTEIAVMATPPPVNRAAPAPPNTSADRAEKQDAVSAKPDTPALAPASTQVATSRPAQSAPPPRRARSSPAQPEQVAALLKRADSQLVQERLSHPPGDNAISTYQEVLKIAPDNTAAKAGLRKVADRYVTLAREKIAEKNYESAGLYIERGLTAMPRHEELGALQVTVRNRIKSEEDFAQAEKLYRGVGVEKDVARAVALYQAAADRGHVDAQYYLGVAYANGEGVEHNEREALKWLRIAATQGQEGAQYNFALGLLFGKSPDPRSAQPWVKRLAERNYAPAFRVLGWMYTTGTGIQQSIVESVRWTAKGVIDNPIGDFPHPDRIILAWQNAFEVAYKRAMAKEPDDSSG